MEPDEDGSVEAAAADGAETAELFSVAIVGRPNVGKSTLFNRLIGDDRSVVHDKPGTTRDAVDTVVETPFGPVRFVDTAGMRRRSRIDPDGEDGRTEYFSAVKALRAVDTADVAMLVIDATQGITHQDQRLAERVDGAGCPVVVLLNKVELLDAEGRADIPVQVGDRAALPRPVAGAEDLGAVGQGRPPSAAVAGRDDHATTTPGCRRRR